MGTAGGGFHWVAPHLDGVEVEVGVGQILTAPVLGQEESGASQGRWAARWYGGNRYRPDNHTQCCCYYASGWGESSNSGRPWYITNYLVKQVYDPSCKRSIRDICMDHL